MKLKGIFIRYAILLLLPLSNLYIFYLIFSPLTIFPVVLLFKLFFNNVLLYKNIIFVNGISLKIIGPCIAGSAYYLLTILNLSIPNKKFNQLAKMLAFSFSILLLFNILRIFLLGSLFIHQNSSFELLHRAFWYFGSVAFVLIIWFLEVKKFKIKEIPFYSDMKRIANYIK